MKYARGPLPTHDIEGRVYHLDQDQINRIILNQISIENVVEVGHDVESGCFIDFKVNNFIYNSIRNIYPFVRRICVQKRMCVVGDVIGSNSEYTSTSDRSLSQDELNEESLRHLAGALFFENMQ